MIVQIVYWVGVLISVYCVYDIFTQKKGTGLAVKILASLFVLVTSWIGAVIYYLFLRDGMK